MLKKIVLVFVFMFSIFSLSSCTKGYENITTDELKTMMVEHPEYQYIDVRTADEYASNGIDTFINYDYYNFSSLEEQIKSDLDTNTTVVVICRSGNRSKSASNKLVSWGYTVYNVTGGMNSYLS